MLEQAVIDAQALKEAAIKNAEQEVMDKYAGEIKEAVDALLEQDDLMSDPMMADPMMDTEGAEQDPALENIPMKATEDLDENGTGPIELDLDSLKKELSMVEEPLDAELPLDMAAAPVDLAAPAADVAAGEMMYESTEQELQELLSDEESLEEDQEDPDSELDEEIELSQEELMAAIKEALTVDLQVVPRGSLGTTHPTRSEQIYAVEVAAAADQDTAVKEENAEFEKALRKIVNLEEQVKSLKSEKNRLVKEHSELKSVARQVSGKLTELNNTNAKLVYQNRILESNSLNERQKVKLVEAISNANSTEEVKVIYNTLHESLNSRDQKAPKNLNEAVSKNNRLVLKSSNKNEQVSDSASKRMKKLAGII
tara:strand:- start:1444 stop:2550 length:1107 start_codon:yes stop_codon:yes gene_type:complete